MDTSKTTLLHRYKKNGNFVLQQAYANNIIDWLYSNHFRIYKYTETNGHYFIYLSQIHDNRDDFSIIYECSRDFTSVSIQYYSFINYKIQKPITPLNSILQMQQDRLQAYMLPSESRSTYVKESKEVVSLEELISYYRNEITYNHALFYSLSSFYCYASHLSDTFNTDSGLYVY